MGCLGFAVGVLLVALGFRGLGLGCGLGFGVLMGGVA